LFRITGRIIPAIFPADMLRPRFVRWLLLSFFVSHNALLSRTPVLGLRHASLSTVLAAHILLAF